MMCLETHKRKEPQRLKWNESVNLQSLSFTQDAACTEFAQHGETPTAT